MQHGRASTQAGTEGAATTCHDSNSTHTNTAGDDEATVPWLPPPYSEGATASRPHAAASQEEDDGDLAGPTTDEEAWGGAAQTPQQRKSPFKRARSQACYKAKETLAAWRQATDTQPTADAGEDTAEKRATLATAEAEHIREAADLARAIELPGVEAQIAAAAALA